HTVGNVVARGAAPAHTPAPPVEMEEDTGSFVPALKKKKRGGCALDRPFQHLKGQAYALTAGAFFDILRHLDEQHRIRLTGWGDSPDRMQDPKLALFISSKVMYYAEYSGPRKLDHQLSYSGGPGEGNRCHASASSTRRRSRPRSPWRQSE